MKTFFNEYGLAMVLAVCVLLIVTMATPVGQGVSASLKDTSDGLSLDKSKHGRTIKGRAGEAIKSLAGDDLTHSDSITLNTVPGASGVDNSVILKGADTNMSGFRYVGEIPREIDGQSVVSKGFILCLKKYNTTTTNITVDDALIGVSNTYVIPYETTPTGIIGETNDKWTIARTTAYGTKKAALTATYWVRAYAELENGDYKYSDVYSFTPFEIAKKIYDNRLSYGEKLHNFLYDSVITKVEPDHTKIDYFE